MVVTLAAAAAAVAIVTAQVGPNGGAAPSGAPLLPGCFNDYSSNRSAERQLPTRACFIRGPNPNDCAHLSHEVVPRIRGGTAYTY